MYEQLLEAALLDIKKLIIENPNDMDLGEKIRLYFKTLPIQIDDFKEKINSDNTYDEGLN